MYKQTEVEHSSQMCPPRIALVSLFIILLAVLQTASVQSAAQSAAPTHSSAALQKNVHSIAPDADTILVVDDFETGSTWDSLVRKASNPHSGSYAGHWTDHPEDPNIKKSFSPALRASDNHKFQFWLHSAVANKASISLVLEPENSTSYEDYYIYDLNIDWVGWRFFNLAISDFRAAGDPNNWDQIKLIRFNSTGWGNSPQPDTALVIDDIQFALPTISNIDSAVKTIDGQAVWQHQITLQNNTDGQQEFELAVAADPSQQLDATLSQSVVTIHSGQTEQINIDIAIVDSPQTNLTLQKTDLTVQLDNKQIDNLLISAYPPIPEHPRLYVQAEDIPALQARFNHPDLAYIRQQLIDQLEETNGGWSDNRRADNDIRRSIEARAFLYLINDDEARGQEAVDMMLDYLDSIREPFDSISEARDLYESMIAAAMVYDWCYDLISDEQRQQMIAGMGKLASLSEYGWPISEKITYLTGHYGEHAPVSFLAAGIATFDEDQTFFNTVYPHFIEGLAPSRNAYYAMGKHHQGTSYSVSRFFHEIHSALLFDAINYKGIYSEDQGKVPYHMLYSRTPSRLYLTEGDIVEPGRVDPRIQMIMAQLHDDPYLTNDAKRVDRDGKFWTLKDSARTFIFWDPALPERPLEELPTARYFPSPSGSMVARTGWDMDGGKQSNVAMAMMNIGEYNFGNHAHLDSGHFGLYYKGTLALDSGVYEGSGGGYNSSHWRNYYQRTIAHNSLLIEDPNEPTPLHYGYEVETRDGGQYRQNYGNEWDSIEQMFNAGKRSEVLAHEIGSGQAPEYTYLKGDLTNGYNPPAEYSYPEKVEEIKRSFVFLDLKNNQHPAALVVFDRITSTDDSFTKKWLLHSADEPQIDGSRISVKRTDGDHNGRMVNDVLLPAAENQRINKIGGENKEFWVDGRNYYSDPKNSDLEPGEWRIELSPANDAYSDTFLNVMHVMDADGGPDPLDTARLDSAKMVGVQIADRAVFFSKSAAALADNIVINVNSGPASVKTMVADLLPGTWYVQTNNGTQTLTASADGKSIYFSAAPGTYTLTRDLSAPTPTPTQMVPATATPTATSAAATSTATSTAVTMPQATPTTPGSTPEATATPWPTVELPTATPRPTSLVAGGDTPFAESFNGISGIIDGVNQWKTSRSFVETNQIQDVYNALSLTGANASAQRPLPIGIDSGGVGTLHFRIKRTGDSDVFVGLSDEPSAESFSAFEVQFGSQFGPFSTSAPNKFTTRNGENATVLDNQFQANVWYCVWLVIDNTTDQYSVHAKGGTLSEITKLGVGGQTNFAFRNGTTDRLQTFYARTGWDSSKVYIDDIYMMPNQINLGSNTSQCQAADAPTPTPTPLGTPMPNTTLTPVPNITVTPAPNATLTPVPNKTVTPTPTATLTPVPFMTFTPAPNATLTPATPVTPAPGTVVVPPTPDGTQNGGLTNITGRVFIDENGNGQYDANERIFPDMIVILIDTSTEGQTMTITAITNAEGIYQFSNIPAANYIISYAIPPGYSSNGGSNFVVDTTQGDTQGPSLGLTEQNTNGNPTNNNNSVYLPLVTR